MQAHAGLEGDACPDLTVGLEPQRILIVRLSSLGDIVHVWPVAHALRERFPRASIAWLTRERFRELLEMNPCVDEVLTLPERKDRYVAGWLGDAIRMIRRIRRQRFDVVLDLHAVQMTHGIVGLSGAPLKLGLDKRNDLGFRMFRYRPLPRGRVAHCVQVYLETLGFLGISSPQPVFPFRIPEAARRRIDGLFGERAVGPEDAVVAIHPGTALPIKRWPEDRFRELMTRLAGLPGLRIVLVHGGAERALLAPGTDDRILHAPPLSHPELAELLGRCALVIGNDSGPLQIAAALGRPTVALFGPSDPWITGPYGSQHTILRGKRPCIPCFRTFRIYQFCKRFTNACMKEPTVEQVFQAVVAQLGMDDRGQEASGAEPRRA